jgi:indole-3-glycerol phosphate synthase
MILDEIAASARRRVERSKEAISIEMLRAQAAGRGAAAAGGTAGGLGGAAGGSGASDPQAMLRGAASGAVGASGPMAAVSPAFPFECALSLPGLAFICEVKKASPSRGIITPDFPYLQIARDYEAAGAAAISVLTEPEYFLGSDEYLREIAAVVDVPVLCKDFVVDEYQIYEAALLGAQALLLICALLETGVLREYIKIAHSLGLSALVEIHSAEEAQSALEAGARIIGINNRDLRTFTVDLGNTGKLRKLIPAGIITVSESGISSPDDIRTIGDYGVDAVLVGEAMMRSPDKRAYLRELREAAREN